MDYMAGNVSEWCDSRCYNHYLLKNPLDPQPSTSDVRCCTEDRGSPILNTRALQDVKTLAY